MFRRPRLPAWGGMVLLLTLAPPVRAQPADSPTRDAARTLGVSGVEAYQAGNYDVASDRLEKAYALINVPSLGLWSARALAKRQLLVEAANRYFEVVSLQLPQGDAAVQHQAQLDAQAELEQLKPKIPRLVVQLRGAAAGEVTLSIDGHRVPSSVIGKPRLMDPGEHRVELQLGSRQRSATVQLAPGGQRSLLLDLTPASGSRTAATPPPAADRSPGSLQRTLGFVTLGAGGAGLIAGSVLGLVASNQHAKLKDSGACSATVCPPEKQADVTRLNTFRTASSVAFIAGGLLASTGVVLLLTAPSRDRQLSARVSPGALWLSGRF